MILRRIKMALQVLWRGWGDYELWSLDTPIAINILARLKRFRATTIGYPKGMTAKRWDTALKRMEKAFAILADEDKAWPNRSLSEEATVKMGLKLFAQYFECLWD